MDFYVSVFELIDMRSFSNLWYWIALAVMWSTVSHWVIGIPYDMVQRARRSGGEAVRDVEDLARVNINRMLYIVRVAGLWLTALVPCVLSALGVLGFWYGIEFAQAVFLMAFPMSIVGAMSLRAARRISRDGLGGDALFSALTRHRIATQIVGVVAIFFTALWGMYQNFTIGVLG